MDQREVGPKRAQELSPQDYLAQFGIRRPTADQIRQRRVRPRSQVSDEEMQAYIAADPAHRPKVQQSEGKLSSPEGQVKWVIIDELTEGGEWTIMNDKLARDYPRTSPIVFMWNKEETGQDYIYVHYERRDTLADGKEVFSNGRTEQGNRVPLMVPQGHIETGEDGHEETDEEFIIREGRQECGFDLEDPDRPGHLLPDIEVRVLDSYDREPFGKQVPAKILAVFMRKEPTKTRQPEEGEDFYDGGFTPVVETVMSYDLGEDLDMMGTPSRVAFLTAYVHVQKMLTARRGGILKENPPGVDLVNLPEGEGEPAHTLIVRYDVTGAPQVFLAEKANMLARDKKKPENLTILDGEEAAQLADISRKNFPLTMRKMRLFTGGEPVRMKGDDFVSILSEELAQKIVLPSGRWMTLEQVKGIEFNDVRTQMMINELLTWFPLPKV